MFDKLIDSAPKRRKRRFFGFFFGTSILYLSALTAALVVSVLVTDPKLADTSELKFVPLVPPPKAGGPDTTPRREQRQQSTQPDIYHPAPIDALVDNRVEEPTADRSNIPPTGPLIQGPGNPNGVRDGDPHSPEFITGIGPDRRSLPEPPEPPPPPTPAARQPRHDDQTPVRVASTVLQGKAAERRTPAYPRLAVIARIEGPVSVEVVISPEGRVEAARAVSGHPLLKPAAIEAARGWRFQPTLLNGTPVRVTGIITFVFKLD